MQPPTPFGFAHAWYSLFGLNIFISQKTHTRTILTNIINRIRTKAKSLFTSSPKT